MMKRLLLMFVGLMAMGYLHAQTDWIEVNSNLPVGNGVGQISVGMLDETALWAVAIDGSGYIVDRFTKSVDGGQNWFPGTFNAGTGLSQLFAINSTTCWAVFNDGANQGLYKTVNGGTTWVKKGTAYGGSSFANLMHFFNENDGVAQGDPLGGYFEIYTTTDGGETWVRVPSANIPAPTSGEYGFTGNYDAVGDHIWFGTNKGRVFHSADKGLHWTASLTNFGASESVQPEFENELNGICFRSYLDLGLETTLDRTTDGGATWTAITVTGPMYGHIITHVPGTESTYVGTASAAGANGISYSTDGGYNWAPITEGYDFITSIWLDNETGWAGSYAQASRSVGGMYIYDGPPLLPFAIPAISVSPESISATAEAGNTDEQELTISNTGEANLTYDVSVIYQLPEQQIAPVSLESEAGNVRTLDNYPMALDPDAKPASYNPPPADDIELHYDGNNSNAVRFLNVPVTPTVAARFPANLTLPHAGMMLTAVKMYINEAGSNMAVKVFDMGTDVAPGQLLVSQSFTGQDQTWLTIQLDNPVYITGADLWVGLQYTQTDTLMAVPGIDVGPANPNGDFVTTGSVWFHLAENPNLNANWNIRAILTGTPMEQWLSVAPASGNIAAGESEVLTVTCDATGLTEGTYNAILRVGSNDAGNPSIDVPVSFEVLPGGAIQTVDLDFEDQADWDQTFDPWSVIDVDGSFTWTIDSTDFPGDGDPMSFIAFNPATTVPPMADDEEILPHGGERFGACMASAEPTYENDDWLISPKVSLGLNSSFTFWVKSYTDQYGLEKYNVLVSTTDMDPDNFIKISEEPYLEAPTDWTEMTYDLSAYDGQDVYVAIQCVTTDAFIFMVDDISISFIVGTPEIAEEIEINVYPNPVRNQLNITSGVEMTEVEIFNQLGQVVFSQVVKDTYFNLNTTGFNAGVYFVRITSDQGIATEKIMIR